MAVHAFFALDSYIYGFAVQEQSLPSGTPEELASMAETVLAALPAAEYPYLREVIVDYVLKVGFDYARSSNSGSTCCSTRSRTSGTPLSATGE